MSVQGELCKVLLLKENYNTQLNEFLNVCQNIKNYFAVNKKYKELNYSETNTYFLYSVI